MSISKCIRRIERRGWRVEKTPGGHLKLIRPGRPPGVYRQHDRQPAGLAQHARYAPRPAGGGGTAVDDLPSITRNAMIPKLQRELKQRRGVFARQVSNKKNLPRDAQWRIAVIEAVIQTGVGPVAGSGQEAANDLARISTRKSVARRPIQTKEFKPS